MLNTHCKSSDKQKNKTMFIAVLADEQGARCKAIISNISMLG